MRRRSFSGESGLNLGLSALSIRGGCFTGWRMDWPIRFGIYVSLACLGRKVIEGPLSG